LSAGTRRSGSSKFGPSKRAGRHGGEQDPHREVAVPAEPYAGRHVSPRRSTARKRAGKVVPAAAVAATLAAGAAAYGLAGSGSPQSAQLSDAAQPVSLSSPAQVGIGDTGSAEAAASAMIQVVKAAGGSVARASAQPQASTSPKAAAKPRTPAPPATTTAAATPTATAAARASATASSKPTASTLSCNLSYGMLPDNVTAIVSFLIANGYSDNAAAGIAGNMYQESKGNPESEGMGGGGLIGFTPLPGGYVTGNPSADLQTQLSAVLTYNQQWAGYLPELNDAATPADAAYIYVTDFERAGIPAASNRESSAQSVAEACGI
jgi:Phage tail lysozyme